MNPEPRIAPLQPPYSPEIAESLRKWMPPGSPMPPLALFRTLAQFPALSERMRGLGALLLGRGMVPARLRELIILRTCARCGAEYEWGVHVTAFAAAVGIDAELVHTTTAAELAPTDDDGGLVLRLADELHDSSRVSPALWESLAARFATEQLVEMLAIAGFYHLIAYVVNGAAVTLEPWAARFPSYGGNM